MALTRVRPPGEWVPNKRIEQAEMEQLDSNASNGVDKRSGQSDNVGSNLAFTGNISFLDTCAFNIYPECVTNIELGNSGSQLAVTNNGLIFLGENGKMEFRDDSLTLLDGGYFDIQNNGTMRVLNEGGIVSSMSGGILTSTPGGIRLGGGSTDWIMFNTAKTKFRNVFPANSGDMTVADTPGGWRVIAGRYMKSNVAASVSAFQLQQHDFANGATLNSMQIFYTTEAHSPVVPCKVEIRRVDFTTDTVASLAVSPVSLTYPNSSIQTTTYTCTQNNILDFENYRYYIYIVEESGGGSLGDVTAITNFKIRYTNITGMKF